MKRLEGAIKKAGPSKEEKWLGQAVAMNMKRCSVGTGPGGEGKGLGQDGRQCAETPGTVVESFPQFWCSVGVGEPQLWAVGGSGFQSPPPRRLASLGVSEQTYPQVQWVCESLSQGLSDRQARSFPRTVGQSRGDGIIFIKDFV